MSAEGKPTINLGGTHPSTLISDYTKAWTALNEAMAAVREAYPHGRDYQVPDSKYEVARREHDDRILKLQQIINDYDDLISHVVETSPPSRR